MPSIIFRILLFIGVFMTYVKNSEATVHPNEIVLNYLNCDAECSVVFLTVRLPNNVRLSLMLKEGIWQTVLDEKGDSFNHINEVAPYHLLATRANQLVRINLDDLSYSIVYQHVNQVFYPKQNGDLIYFSDATISSPKLINPNQGRHLWQYSIKTGELRRILSPWNAYSIGFPFLGHVNDLCVNMVLPRKDGETGSTPHGLLHEKSAFCFSRSVLISKELDEQSLVASALPGDAGSLQDIFVDNQGRFVSGFNYKASLGAWDILDIQEKKLVRRIKAKGRDCLVVSGNGLYYAHATVSEGQVFVDIHLIETSVLKKRLHLDINTIQSLKLRRKSNG